MYGDRLCYCLFQIFKSIERILLFFYHALRDKQKVIFFLNTSCGGKKTIFNYK